MLSETHADIGDEARDGRTSNIARQSAVRRTTSDGGAAARQPRQREGALVDVAQQVAHSRTRTAEISAGSRSRDLEQGNGREKRTMRVGEREREREIARRSRDVDVGEARGAGRRDRRGERVVLTSNSASNSASSSASKSASKRRGKGRRSGSAEIGMRRGRQGQTPLRPEGVEAGKP